MTARNLLFTGRQMAAAVMLTRPRLAARILGDSRPGRPAAFVLRALGARDLLQAAALRRAAPAALLLGAGVDATHGLTAVVFAQTAPDRRVPGLRSAALAGVFCVAELGVAWRGHARES